MQGYTTYRLLCDHEIRHIGYFWKILEQNFPPEVKEGVKGMRMSKDSKGVVFDLPNEFSAIVKACASVNGGGGKGRGRGGEGEGRGREGEGEGKGRGRGGEGKGEGRGGEGKGKRERRGGEGEEEGGEGGGRILGSHHWRRESGCVSGARGDVYG